MFTTTKWRMKESQLLIRRVLADVGCLHVSMLLDNLLSNITIWRILSLVRRTSSTGTRLREQTTSCRISVRITTLSNYILNCQQ